MYMLSFLLGSSNTTWVKVEHWVTLRLYEQVRWKVNFPLAPLIPSWWKWGTDLHHFNLHHLLASKCVCKLSSPLTNTEGDLGENGVLFPLPCSTSFYLLLSCWDRSLAHLWTLLTMPYWASSLSQGRVIGVLPSASMGAGVDNFLFSPTEPWVKGK